ncbi:transposase domain-containing protein [Paracoccus spongiarum]|uniref:Transposase domain-containing protein n=1 Tax=Paracoccus spongiarum TaxID=3064387 RepID=A0ABT9JEA5_9RHOB|nr:transposase domain-containing protein [Paracoccus sp. 2205BS29-5]MDP5308156.1 transposase domain-containing protein [Paracoccus sp. 2205BS29-5]
MTLRVADIVGLPGVPTTKRGVRDWLKAHQVTVDFDRNRFTFEIADLPLAVRRAYELRQIEASGLPAGEYDDAAHDRLVAATPAMQTAALRKAKIARFLVLRGGSADVPLTGELVAAVRSEFGSKGTDKMTLKRILKAVAGVDPINFAPALLPEYDRGGRPKAEISPEAWSFFMTAIKKAAPTWPLRSAWKDVRDLAESQGWAWPPYKTVLRRWDALSEAQKRAARFGRDNAVSSLNMPVKRDLTSIRPLEWVSLDGRTLGFWVDFGDGKPVRPVMIALVDSASHYVLGYELERSENAVATARLIRNVCQIHGIFDRLYTDNGAAFAGHLVAGGAKFKWRGKGKGQPGVKPLGVCYHLGIEPIFTVPKNAQAKIAERTFATLSRDIDDRPEFEGAHAGQARIPERR